MPNEQPMSPEAAAMSTAIMEDLVLRANVLASRMAHHGMQMSVTVTRTRDTNNVIGVNMHLHLDPVSNVVMWEVICDVLDDKEGQGKLG